MFVRSKEEGLQTTLVGNTVIKRGYVGVTEVETKNVVCNNHTAIL